MCQGASDDPVLCQALADLSPRNREPHGPPVFMCRGHRAMAWHENFAYGRASSDPAAQSNPTWPTEIPPGSGRASAAAGTPSAGAVGGVQVLPHEPAAMGFQALQMISSCCFK